MKDDSWKQEWLDMPEFEMEDQSSYRKIFVHFRNEEDVQAFAKLLEQKISPKQKALWFPEMQPRRYGDKLYIDEERG